MLPVELSVVVIVSVVAVVFKLELDAEFVNGDENGDEDKLLAVVDDVDEDDGALICV